MRPINTYRRSAGLQSIIDEFFCKDQLEHHASTRFTRGLTDDLHKAAISLFAFKRRL